MLERRAWWVLLIALLTGCGAGPHRVEDAEVKRGSDGYPERYIYEGDVEIEPVALDALLDRLLRAGCGRLPRGGVGGCSVAIEEGSSQRRLVIYPTGQAGCFGPCKFWIDGSKLYSKKDIQGEPDDDKFKKEVRKDVRKLGSFVKIDEDTWSIQSRDARGIMY
jgi:hypothetical protein